MAQQMVQAACPGCRHSLQIPAAWIGQTLKCKHCGMMFAAQGTAPAAVKAAVPAPQPVARRPIDKKIQATPPKVVLGTTGGYALQPTGAGGGAFIGPASGWRCLSRGWRRGG